MSRRINQGTLARKLRLSVATVSRSLQDHPGISAKTKQLVRTEAEKLGYHRRSSAFKRPLGVLGVLIPCYGTMTAGTQLDTMYLFGMSKAAEEHDLTLAVHHFQTADESRLLDASQRPPALRSGLVSGLVLLHHFQADTVAGLARSYPVATIAHAAPEVPVAHVDSDHFAAFSGLIRHLKDLGHRRIGYVMRRSSTIPLARLGSFIRAMMLADLPWGPQLVEEIPYNAADEAFGIRLSDDMADGQKAAIDRITARTRAGTTAWACDCDSTAYWLHDQLRERGLRIPEDVSLTGYDGFDPPAGRPQATTVTVPFQDMGRLAITLLVERLRRPAEPFRIGMVRCGLLMGGTTGPASAR